MRSGGAGVSPAKTRSGAIASRVGSATATPSPRRTARREICLVIVHLAAARAVPPKLERVAPRDFQDQGGHPVSPVGHRPADGFHRRRVVILYAPVEGVGQ